MDSQDRDGPKIKRREELLARRIGEALDQMKPLDAQECPDAETLAAYAEQELTPVESAQWESHFATCARCRKILRVLAASSETPLAEKEVAQLGKLVSTVCAPVEISRGAGVRDRSRVIDWRTRWLAPALGVAAVLAVWFAMRPPWRSTDRGASPTLVAQAPKEEVPPATAAQALDQLSRVAPPQDQKTQPASPRDDRLSANIPSLKSAAGASAERRTESGNAIKKISPSDSLAESTLQKEEKSGTSQAEPEVVPPASPAPPPPDARAKAAMAAPAPAPLPQARAQADMAPPPVPAAPGSVSQTVTVTEAAPVVEATNETAAGTIQQEASTDLPSKGRDRQAIAALRPTRELSVILKASTGSTLWRAGRGGIIERSIDAGKTWASQMATSREDWLAGAAVSGTVCWLAGRNGAIARAIDGQNWGRIAPPAISAGGDAKLPDWAGVTARDAQSATITARDGRRFATPDGGQTWQPQ